MRSGSESRVDVVEGAGIGAEQVLGDNGQATSFFDGVVIVRRLEGRADLVFAERRFQVLRDGDAEIVDAEAVLIALGEDVHDRLCC